MISRPPSLTRQQSTVQVKGFEVDEVPEPFGDPASQPEVVGKVQVLQTVQVAQALGHLSLRESRVTCKEEGVSADRAHNTVGGGVVNAKNKIRTAPQPINTNQSYYIDP